VTLVGDVRTLLRHRGFPRLYATRLLSQTADGIFQASLAGAILFDPEHQTDARRVAAGFAVVLLPWSVVGPFAGVLLDRWQRARVLVLANVVRVGFIGAEVAVLLGAGPTGVPFFLAALAVIGVNRFYLSALSASLPHVVDPDELVMGNGVSTTSGTLLTAAGAGLGLAVRSVAGTGDAGNATVAACAAVLYLAAAAVARGFPVTLLGPGQPAAQSTLATTLGRALSGFRGGLRHLGQRPAASTALLAIGAGRFCYGLTSVATILLYRNYFHGQGLLRSGLTGLVQVVVAAGVGAVLAAAVTPLAVRRVAKPWWIVTMLSGSAAVVLGLGLPFTKAALLLAGLLFGFTAQSAKICVDTIVQENVEDAFRGRVFSVYDTVFNVAFVAAAVLGAVELPRSGKSVAVLIVAAAGYGVAAAGYATAVRVLKADRPAAPRSTAAASAAGAARS